MEKKQKDFLLPDHQLAESLTLALVCRKGQKEDKSLFATKSIGIYRIFFHVKIFLKLLDKIFAKQ